MKKILLFLVIISVGLFAQNKEAEVILQKVRDQYNKVNDYSVDVHIKLDVSMLKAPESDAKIYFKKPDKIQIESNAFAMLPKNGMNISPLSLISKDYIAILEKEETINGVNNYVVKVIPSGENNDIILSTLWVDSKTYSINKISGETRNSGKYIVDFIYNGKTSYNLPAEMIFTFNLAKPNLSGFNNDNSNKDVKKKEMKGKVYLKYSNYVVNKGIPDEVFNKKKK